MAKGENSGKRAGVKREPNLASAGAQRSIGSNTYGDTRTFKGSGVRSYNYTRVINGIRKTVTIRAHSVREANAIAASQGYKSSDRDIKRRRKRK